MCQETHLQGISVPLHKAAEDHWKAAGIQIPEAIRAR